MIYIHIGLRLRLCYMESNAGSMKIQPYSFVFCADIRNCMVHCNFAVRPCNNSYDFAELLDPVCPVVRRLLQMGVDLEWHCYPKQTHIASPEQFRHVADFLEKLRGNVKLKEAEGKLSEPGAVVIKSPVAAMTPKALENLPVDKIKEFVVDFMEQCNDRSRILKMALGAFD